MRRAACFFWNIVKVAYEYLSTLAKWLWNTELYLFGCLQLIGQGADYWLISLLIALFDWLIAADPDLPFKGEGVCICTVSFSMVVSKVMVRLSSQHTPWINCTTIIEAVPPSTWKQPEMHKVMGYNIASEFIWSFYSGQATLIGWHWIVCYQLLFYIHMYLFVWQKVDRGFQVKKKSLLLLWWRVTWKLC